MQWIFTLSTCELYTRKCCYPLRGHRRARRRLHEWGQYWGGHEHPRAILGEFGRNPRLPRKCVHSMLVTHCVVCLYIQTVVYFCMLCECCNVVLLFFDIKMWNVPVLLQLSAYVGIWHTDCGHGISIRHVKCTISSVAPFRIEEVCKKNGEMLEITVFIRI